MTEVDILEQRSGRVLVEREGNACWRNTCWRRISNRGTSGRARVGEHLKLGNPARTRGDAVVPGDITEYFNSIDILCLQTGYPGHIRARLHRPTDRGSGAESGAE